jgi:SPASM domain peptide maturase of grasp-with-spasm system
MYLNSKAIPNDVPFAIYADCISVKGHARSTICDLTRNTFVFIPNALFEIISMHAGKTLYEIKTLHENKYDTVIDEYFAFLLENEMVFFSHQWQQFPKIKLNKWDEPHTILHCIIDLDKEVDYINHTLVSSLETLSCQSLQLRCFEPMHLDYILETIKKFEFSCVENIELILKYQKEIPFEAYLQLCESNLRVNRIIITEAPKYEHKGVAGENALGNIIYVTDKIASHQYCGIISPKYFTINLKTFSESQQHNTCLNRKISIDVKGNIKNCPSMTKSFGHINVTTLEAALEKNGFKAYWKINKDKIKVCKDCEFRHVCTDCRAYIEEPKDQYSKPLKCGYNPYTNEWEDWSENPLKRKVIADYRLREIKG